MEEAGSHRHRHIVVVVVTLALAVVLLAPCAVAYPLQVCGSSGDFTANSTYQANLGLLAGALPKNASSSPDLFATAVVGAVPDQVSALALCRGDANATACSGCLATAFRDVQNMCAYAKDAALYYEHEPCMLYYSNTPFLSSVDNVRSRMQINADKVTTDPSRFNSQVAALVDATAGYAAYNSTRRYASGEADLDASSEFPRVYSWAQCTPDLTPAQCHDCLAGIIKRMPRFADRVGAKILGVRCSYRYEIYTFLGGPVMMVRLAAPAPEPAVGPTVPTPSTLARRGKLRNKTVLVLAIALALFVAILAITTICHCYSRKRRTRPATASNSTTSEDIASIDSLIVDLSTLRRATDNFAEANKLGEGGFGVVYKGNLPDGREIAVKRLSRSSAQGIGELKNELALVAKLQHKNLVRLVGVCVQEHEKLLAYEYMPNKSVDTILFDRERSRDLSWRKRLKVISGIARGLQYLHEDSQLRIIHRDLKASNVLLDSDYTPKISDFGLARLFGTDQTREVTNRVVGTYGYMAPEYAVRGRFSVKSDVFSFGVLILEVVTGRRSSCSSNFDESVNLLSLVWEHWTTGTTVEIIDSSLRGHAPGNQVVKLFHIGLLCVQDNPADRPMMSTVNFMLSSNTVSLRSPSKPSFLMCMSPNSSRSTDMPGMESTNEVSITELEPR